MYFDSHNGEWYLSTVCVLDCGVLWCESDDVLIVSGFESIAIYEVRVRAPTGHTDVVPGYRRRSCCIIEDEDGRVVPSRTDAFIAACRALHAVHN